MDNSSFIKKIVMLLFIIIVIVIIAFFVMNKKTVEKQLNDVEKIGNINMNTYDEDVYIYSMDTEKIYTSEYFYNNYYLLNNDVKFDEYKIDDNTKFYLKTLSNSVTDINDIKISYDPITKDEFNYLLKNYTLLKVYIWQNSNDVCKNILLYSSNNIDLEVEHY